MSSRPNYPRRSLICWLPSELHLSRRFGLRTTDNKNSVKGLLLGGQGTTVNTLCVSIRDNILVEGPTNTSQYLNMLLSKNPEVVQRLRNEHDAVFGRSTAETLSLLESDPSKLNDLEYTSAVIKETLRLFPVGFGIRQAPAG